MNTPQKPQFTAERSKTNESLTAERNKATEVLDTASEKSSAQTDQIVKDQRDIADQKTAHSRTEHDDGRKNEIIPADQVRLNKEREQSDLATDIERSKVDLALGKERSDANKMVATVLKRERTATDKNLLSERDATDLNLHGSSHKLRNEEADHARTKVSLTSRDEFLAIVSHDLRNPIGAARSYAEILLDESKYGHLEPEVKKYLAAIKRNTDSSLRLISDLLDVERMAQGNLVLSIRRQNVEQMLRDSIETFANEASSKNISLKVAPWSREGAVECDPDRIMQVISNLLGNAVKFTPIGGEILIRASFSELEMQISVRDSGPGIPDAQKTKIFERFAQLGVKNRTGLGLGLYISRMLIEAHHGQLWVESEVAHGSTFCLAIPKLQAITAPAIH